MAEVPARKPTDLLPALLWSAGVFAVLALAGAIGLPAAAGGTIAAWAVVLWQDRRHRRALARASARASGRSEPDPEAVSPATRLRAKIVEGIDDPLLLLDPAKRVLDANRAARELLGERIVGRDVGLNLRHPDVLEAIDELLGDGGGDETRKIEITHTGTVERIYAVTAARVSNRESERAVPAAGAAPPPAAAFYIVISMHDITQTKRAERMRADFVANASHELRTPLSSLIGFIETLRGPAQGDREAAERFLGIMEEEAQRMVRVIDDLLSLSRIEMDKHVRPETRADIGEILDSVANALEPAAKEARKRLVVDAGTDLPPVRGDRDQIFQMVQNLVANAVKYADPDTSIRISALPVARVPEMGEPGVHIRVADEGPGIAPEHLPRLTERFYRVDAARSRKIGGTGLGLAIVKHIVSRHRGQLDIESALGTGTTVHVMLPAAPRSPDSSGAAGGRVTALPAAQ